MAIMGLCVNNHVDTGTGRIGVTFDLPSFYKKVKRRLDPKATKRSNADLTLKPNLAKPEPNRF